MPSTFLSMAEQEKLQMNCDNFRHFKETLKTLRLLDDKIIYKLNKSVPTQSFKHKVDAESKCKQLYTELLGYYKYREDEIKKCIQRKTEKIETLKKKIVQERENSTFQKDLRTEQSALKLIQSELLVEDVVKSRSLKVFNEKCWKAYTPSS